MFDGVDTETHFELRIVNGVYERRELGTVKVVKSDPLEVAKFHVDLYKKAIDGHDDWTPEPEWVKRVDRECLAKWEARVKELSR